MIVSAWCGGLALHLRAGRVGRDGTADVVGTRPALRPRPRRAYRCRLRHAHHSWALGRRDDGDGQLWERGGSDGRAGRRTASRRRSAPAKRGLRTYHHPPPASPFCVAHRLPPRNDRASPANTRRHDVLLCAQRACQRPPELFQDHGRPQDEWALPSRAGHRGRWVPVPAPYPCRSAVRRSAGREPDRAVRRAPRGRAQAAARALRRDHRGDIRWRHIQTRDARVQDRRVTPSFWRHCVDARRTSI